jgi:phosphohistidine phosphatase
MYLYLIQHGEAKSESEDPNRSLTERGRTETLRVANNARKLGVNPYKILHSEKLRARQTAEIMADILGVKKAEIASGLNPNDDVHPWAGHISKENQDIMIVGHLPFMDRLVSLLVCGNENAGVILFRYSAIICLEQKQGSRWSIHWILTSEMCE